MTRLFLALLFFITSCTTVNKLSDKIEVPHYALYKQKVLFVHSVSPRKVTFTNPARTRFYLLKGRRYALKWIPGDTFVIANNLEAFYDLKFKKKGNNKPGEGE